MKQVISYETIKELVNYSFEEYVDEDGYTSSQASAKIFEECWRKLNYNLFAKTSFYICIAIHCFKLKSIPDFVYSKLAHYFDLTNLNEPIGEKDLSDLEHDIIICKELYEQKNYEITKSTEITQKRIEYILGLKP